MTTIKQNNCIYCGKQYTNKDNNTYGDLQIAKKGVLDSYVCENCSTLTSRRCLDCGVVLWSGITSPHPQLCFLCLTDHKFTCNFCNRTIKTTRHTSEILYIIDKYNKIDTYHTGCFHKLQTNNILSMDYCGFCGYNIYTDALCVVDYVSGQSFMNNYLMASHNSRNFCKNCADNIFYDTLSSFWVRHTYKCKIAETNEGVPVYTHTQNLLFPANTEGKILCPECGEYHLYLIKRTGNCIKCSFKPRVVINNYSFKPVPIFFKAPDEDTTNLFFGVENEISFKSINREDKEDIITNLLANNFWYFKTDSSIANGYECVTHPGSLKYWQTCAKDDFKQMFNMLSIRPHSSCGLHIHMPKDAFTNAHLFKFGFFITNEIEFFSKLAGRKPNSYCCLDSTDAIIKKAIDKKGTSGRYTAVNTKPEHTVEVRLFSGKVTFEAMLHDVECLAALYDFTQKARVADITKAKFIEFVRSNAEGYSTLIKNTAFISQ